MLSLELTHAVPLANNCAPWVRPSAPAISIQTAWLTVPNFQWLLTQITKMSTTRTSCADFTTWLFPLRVHRTMPTTAVMHPSIRLSRPAALVLPLYL